jgi:tRNA threonylcarbamoyladenosine biosynthesis protein TsaB
MTAPVPTHGTDPGRPFLVLEASTGFGSVALVVAGQCLAARPVAMGVGRDDQLFPAVISMLAGLGVEVGGLAGIVCGSGPGSFTSLRIAASIAKGFAHGGGIPLFAVSSLVLAAADAVGTVPSGPYLVHSDALRGERYAQPVWIGDDALVREVGALQRLTVAQLDGFAEAGSLLAVGTLPAHDRAVRTVHPAAALLVRVAAVCWDTPVALDGWEPAYGRLAEAQVKWEAAHGTTLSTAGSA